MDGIAKVFNRGRLKIARNTKTLGPTTNCKARVSPHLRILRTNDMPGTNVVGLYKQESL